MEKYKLNFIKFCFFYFASMIFIIAIMYLVFAMIISFLAVIPYLWIQIVLFFITAISLTYLVGKMSDKIIKLLIEVLYE